MLGGGSAGAQVEPAEGRQPHAPRAVCQGWQAGADPTLMHQAPHPQQRQNEERGSPPPAPPGQAALEERKRA